MFEGSAVGGFKLLLLPDVQVMGPAIEKHALEHKKEYGLTQEQTESLKDYLIVPAFELGSENLKQEDQGEEFKDNQLKNHFSINTLFESGFLPRTLFSCK